MPKQTCGGQRTTCRSQISPSPIWALGITQVLRLSWVISPGTWLLLQCSVCISLQGPKLLAPLHERAAHGGHQGSCLYCSRAVTKDRKILILPTLSALPCTGISPIRDRHAKSVQGGSFLWWGLLKSYGDHQIFMQVFGAICSEYANVT